MVNTTGALLGYTGPARAYYTPSGPVEAVGLYGPVGSGTTPDIRVIPITVEYARYVKIGKKVTCWVNFTISPEFNWITKTYSGTVASPTYTTTYTAGSNSSRCDFLYNTNSTWRNSCAIGLTLPFGASNEPTAGAVGTLSLDTETDQLSGTVLAGSFNLQIDNTVNDPFLGVPTYPIVQYPALYQEPLSVSAGVATGGTVQTSAKRVWMVLVEM